MPFGSPPPSGFALTEDIKTDVATAVKAHAPVADSQTYTTVGEPVVACESIIVSLTGLSEDQDPTTSRCSFCGERANVVAVVARDCAWTAEDDGTDDPDKVVTVSNEMIADGKVLAEIGKERIDSGWSVAFQMQGGLGITTLTMDLPVPCVEHMNNPLS